LCRTITNLEKAQFAAKLAESKKAEDIIILNIGRVSNICDYFVISSAGSIKRVETIVKAIEEGFEKENIKIFHTEGKDSFLWTILDAGGVVIHIFRSDIRQFYSLERLWQHAPRINYP
jgi:ribosome-associated protein